MALSGFFLTIKCRLLGCNARTEFVEIKRDSRYVIVMEVPPDLSPAERTVLFDAVENLRESLNKWIYESDDKFMVVITVRGMPINIYAVKEEENSTDVTDN